MWRNVQPSRALLCERILAVDKAVSQLQMSMLQCQGGSISQVNGLHMDAKKRVKKRT